MQFENLQIFFSSDENIMPEMSHCNTFYFLRYGYVRYVKCLFTSNVNNSEILEITNAKLSGIVFI